MVNLKVLDINGQEIDLATGMDFGMCRKGVESIKEIKIRNDGDITARSLIIASTTFNSSNEVTEEEYLAQQIASRWKGFSLEKDGVYLSQLNLGDVKPNAYVEGIKVNNIDLNNSNTCIMKEVFRSADINIGGGKFVLSHVSEDVKDGSACRYNLEELGSIRDFEVEFNVDFTETETPSNQYTPTIIFPVRLNSNGDGKGYLFMLQYRKNDKRFMVSIWKNGLGIQSHYDREYGTKIFNATSYLEHDKSKKITFKIYNNNSGLPTFEVKVDGNNILLQKPNLSSTQSYIVSDMDKTYTTNGKSFMDLSIGVGDATMELSNIAIKSEELEQVIYVRTLLDDRAEDQKKYKASLIVSYLE